MVGGVKYICRIRNSLQVSFMYIGLKVSAGTESLGSHVVV